MREGRRTDEARGAPPPQAPGVAARERGGSSGCCRRDQWLTERVCRRLTAACTEHDGERGDYKRPSAGERQPWPRQPRRRRAVLAADRRAAIDRAGARMGAILAVVPRRVPSEGVLRLLSADPVLHPGERGQPWRVRGGLPWCNGLNPRCCLARFL